MSMLCHRSPVPCTGPHVVEGHAPVRWRCCFAHSAIISSVKRGKAWTSRTPRSSANKRARDEPPSGPRPRSPYGAKVTEKTSIALHDKYVGLAAKLDAPNTETLARFYIANGRLFQVMVSGKHGTVNRSDAETFFESFDVIQ
jgi:hypothetical protein